jgi:predicted TPR repeat methyltransferase
MSNANTDILNQARAAIDRFDAAQALTLLTPLQFSDDSAEYLACLIEAQAQARHFDAAETLVARASGKYPEDIGVRMAAGFSAVHARNYPLALERYLQVTRLKADYAPAYNNLGMVHEYLHDEAQALAAYALAIRHNPSLAPAYRNLGRLAEMAGRLDEAKTYYEQGREHAGAAVGFEQLLAGLGHNFSAPPQAQIAATPETLLAAEIAAAAERHLPGDRRLAVLDLICGEGIVGSALWRKSGVMIGVDPRIQWLHQAQARNIYYDLQDQAPAAYLRTCKRGETDLITANCAFVDQGDLLPVFLNLYAVLAPGGLLVMAFPTQTDHLGYYIEGRGLFSHDPRYVLERADFEGMRLLERVDYSAETHPGMDRTYSLMVFAKPA